MGGGDPVGVATQRVAAPHMNYDGPVGCRGDPMDRRSCGGPMDCNAPTGCGTPNDLMGCGAPIRCISTERGRERSGRLAHRASPLGVDPRDCAHCLWRLPDGVVLQVCCLYLRPGHGADARACAAESKSMAPAKPGDVVALRTGVDSQLAPPRAM